MAFAIVLGAGAAHAADYPRVDPGLLPPGVPVLMWQGAYFGANVGWGTGKMRGEADVQVDPLPAPPEVLRGSLNSDGAFVGVHAGYNFLSDTMLYGIEADIQFARISGGLYDVDLDAGINGRLRWFSTLRGRVGMTSGNFLLYGTAGLAVGGGQATAYVGSDSASRRRTHVGWTAGAGAEFAVNHELSVRLEYLYADFGKKNYVSVPDVIEADVGIRAHLFRIGVTAHF
ncbi:MAG: porin family protein [Bradyrhizobiaceae bacterium]|nr:porin family protein [Bradyrhizobiaceae bacterium]